MNSTLCPCKINLGLYVTERRPDGYHNIETAFYPIPLYDELCVVEDDEDRLLLSGIPVAGDLDDNLVMRVLRQLRHDYDIPPVCIKLQKNIPSGAGLGGGSSDAASMMMQLNEIFLLGMSEEEMEQRVSRLGADCAFFIKAKPTLARGIGNEFSPIDLCLDGWHLVLVKPDDFVSTREAYAMVTPKSPVYSLADVLTTSPECWRDRLFNDFEQSVLLHHPTIADIKERLYQLGATYACMSGSGSSVFGLFREQPLGDMAELFHPHFVFCCQL